MNTMSKLCSDNWTKEGERQRVREGGGKGSKDGEYGMWAVQRGGETMSAWDCSPWSLHFLLRAPSGPLLLSFPFPVPSHPPFDATQTSTRSK